MIKDSLAGESHAERMMAALNVMKDAFCYYDSDDRLVLYNEAMLDLYRGLADVIRPGVSYEELHDIGVARGLWEIRRRRSGRMACPDAQPAPQPDAMAGHRQDQRGPLDHASRDAHRRWRGHRHLHRRHRSQGAAGRGRPRQRDREAARFRPGACARFAEDGGRAARRFAQRAGHQQGVLRHLEDRTRRRARGQSVPCADGRQSPQRHLRRGRGPMGRLCRVAACRDKAGDVAPREFARRRRLHDDLLGHRAFRRKAAGLLL